MNRNILKKLTSAVMVASMMLAVLPASAETKYSDVTVTNPSYDDIMLLSELGVVEGMGGGQFAPESYVKRADFIIMLSKLMGVEAEGDKSFPDVNESDYFYSEVIKAANAGIISGRENGYFDPNAVITTQEAVKIIIYANEKLSGTVMQISEPQASKNGTFWARDEVDKAITGNIIKEMDFSANELVTRAKACKMLSGLFALNNSDVKYDYSRETKIIQKQRGNIFTDADGAPEIEIDTGYPIVEYLMVDFWGNTVRHGYKKVQDRTTSLKFENLDFGHYNVFIYGSDDKGYRTEIAKTTISYLKKFEAAPAEESPFGVGFHATRSNYGWKPDLIYEASLIGARHIRDEWYWSNVETKKGSYTNWIKELTDLCQEYEIAFDPVSGFVHPSYDGGKRPYTEDGQIGFANMQNAYFDLLTDRKLFKRMEMYNEWYNRNTLYGAPYTINDMEYLVELYKKSWEIIKEKHPEAILAGMTRGLDTEWNKYYLYSGALDYIDELTVHAYVNSYEGEYLRRDENGHITDAIEPIIADGVEVLKKDVKAGSGKTLGVDLPWGVTETGYQTVNFTEQQQAVLYPRLMTCWLHEGATYVFTYDFLCDGNDERAHEDNFGIMNAMLSDWGSYTGRGAYVSFGVNARMIDNKKSTNKELKDNVYCYDFTNGTQSVKIFNTETYDPKTVCLYTDGKVQVTDMMGATREFVPYDGKVYLTISEDMTYVTGNVTDWEVTDGIYFNQPKSAVMGSDFALTAESDAFDVTDFTYEVAGKEYNADEIIIPASYEERERIVRVLVKHDGAYVGEFKQGIMVGNRYELNVAYKMQKNENSFTPSAELTIKNRVDEDLDISAVAFTVNGENKVVEIGKTVKNGETLTYTAELGDCIMYKEYEISCRIIENGKMSKYIDGSGKTVYAPMVRYTMAIDGIIDEGIEDKLSTIDFESMYNLWQNGLPMWGGTNDLSGQAWVSYDDENLYVAVSVVDDVHLANKPGGYCYQQDCLQLGLYHEIYEESLGTYDAVDEGMAGFHEVGFYLAGGSESKLYRYGSAKECDDMEKWDGVSFKITRDDNTKRTNYEIALPWSELGVSPANTDHYGIEIVVQDSDEDLRTNAYYLNGNAIHLNKNRFDILQYEIIK